ncbi:hypothetical protein H5410_006475 [Solanum commersonii]|uniref:Uncharacterized protein n=1 Tax=Solanum commersonii TaxID=4109 RepID=A0A9J6A9U6_SOLCO|nr:hypothetical protein H5410_006475 [Solanum commersonii]
MDKYVTRLKIRHPSSSSTHPSIASTIAPKIQRETFISNVDLEFIEADPEIRKPIAEYNPNIRDDIRRYYILKSLVNLRIINFLKLSFERKCGSFFLIDLMIVSDWSIA